MIPVLRLLLGDLIANLRVWAGAIVVAVAAAAVATVTAAQIETAVRTGGTTALALYVISGTMIMFTTLTTVIVLGSIVNLAVALQRRPYALWQLIGIRPGRIRLVVLTQLLIVAVLGAVVGCAVTVPALPSLFQLFFEGANGIEGVGPKFGLVGAAAVVAFVAVVVLLSGARGAGQASRVPAVQSLREADLSPRRMGVLRWLSAAAVLLILVSVLLSLPSTAVGSRSVPLMLLAPLTAGLLAALSPWLYPRLLRAWTALIPATVSASWFLARNAAAQNVGRSTASISPLMTAVALAAGFYTATQSANAAVGRTTLTAPADVALGTVALVIGGPVLLAVLGATATVFMSGRSREREFALIQAAGGTSGTVLAAAAWEAFIYGVTAVALGAAAVLVTALAGVWLTHGWVFAGGAVAVVAAGGSALILAATVLPTLSALRAEVPRTLAAE